VEGELRKLIQQGSAFAWASIGHKSVCEGVGAAATKIVNGNDPFDDSRAIWSLDKGVNNDTGQSFRADAMVKLSEKLSFCCDDGTTLYGAEACWRLFWASKEKWELNDGSITMKHDWCKQMNCYKFLLAEQHHAEWLSISESLIGSTLKFHGLNIEALSAPVHFRLLVPWKPRLARRTPAKSADFLRVRARATLTGARGARARPKKMICLLPKPVRKTF